MRHNEVTHAGPHPRVTHQLLPDGLLEGLRAAAGQHRGTEPEGAQHLHAVLRRLGLLLADDADDGDQAHMHYAHVL